MQNIIEALEKVYGKPASTGFGSAVFYEVSKKDQSLAGIALEDYKLFMGEKWTPETASTWMSGWKLVYERNPGLSGDIITELNNIKDPGARRSLPLLTEFINDPNQAKAALEAAFNNSNLAHLELFTIGDNAEMNGLLLCGLYTDYSACTIICLMD